MGRAMGVMRRMSIGFMFGGGIMFGEFCSMVLTHYACAYYQFVWSIECSAYDVSVWCMQVNVMCVGLGSAYDVLCLFLFEC